MRIKMLFMLASLPVILLAAGIVESQKLDCNINDRNDRLVLLNKALSTDDAPCVKRILDTGVDPNGLIAELSGTAPILIASELGNVEILEALFNAGVRRADPATLAAFFALIQKKNLPGVKVFLKAGVPVDLKDEYGGTPLMAAASLGVQDIAKYLLENGANPNAKTVKGTTILMSASKGVGDDPELLMLLLKAGAKIDAVSKDRRNAAFFALEFSNLRKLEYLLRSGIDSSLTDLKGRTLKELAEEIMDPSTKSEALELIERFKNPKP